MNINKFLWKVELYHAQETYNDSDEYAIYNYCDDIIVIGNWNRIVLDAICVEHNKDIFSFINK
jgi:hypothetical protein